MLKKRDKGASIRRKGFWGSFKRVPKGDCKGLKFRGLSK